MSLGLFIFLTVMCLVIGGLLGAVAAFLYMGSGGR